MSVVTAVEATPGERRVVIDAAAVADLELILAGVRIPWTLLGGSLGRRGTGRVAVPVGNDVAVLLATHDRVVLTDGTLVPLARLDAIEVDGGDHVATVTGIPTRLGAPAPAEWRQPATHVLLAQRPPLRGELDRILAEHATAGDSDASLLVAIPAGPTPDGIPAAVLRESFEAVLAGSSAARVVSIPVVWRDPASNDALVEALAEAFGSPVEVLDATDPPWPSIVLAVESGDVPSLLDDTTHRALLAWRPPPQSRGLVVFFTGYSGSGKSSLAVALVEHLHRHSRRTVSLLDGDLVRLLLSSGLGFDRAGRDLNIRRIGFVAAEIARHHGIAVCAPIAPFHESRAAVRTMVEQVGDFVLVHVATPLEECERRDRKGLYAKARTGEIPDFTGISSPYEVPTDADLVLDTTEHTLEESLGVVLDHLRSGGWITS